MIRGKKNKIKIKRKTMVVRKNNRRSRRNFTKKDRLRRTRTRRTRTRRTRTRRTRTRIIKRAGSGRGSGTKKSVTWSKGRASPHSLETQSLHNMEEGRGMGYKPSSAMSKKSDDKDPRKLEEGFYMNDASIKEIRQKAITGIPKSTINTDRNNAQVNKMVEIKRKYINDLRKYLYSGDKEAPREIGNEYGQYSEIDTDTGIRDR